MLQLIQIDNSNELPDIIATCSLCFSDGEELHISISPLTNELQDTVLYEQLKWEWIDEKCKNGNRKVGNEWKMELGKDEK